MPIAIIPTILHKGVTLKMNFIKVVGSGDVRYEIIAECNNGTFLLPKTSVLTELSKECRIQGFKEVERSEAPSNGTNKARVIFDFVVARRPHQRAAYLAAISTRIQRFYP